MEKETTDILDEDDVLNRSPNSNKTNENKLDASEKNKNSNFDSLIFKDGDTDSKERRNLNQKKTAKGFMKTIHEEPSSSSFKIFSAANSDGSGCDDDRPTKNLRRTQSVKQTLAKKGRSIRKRLASIQINNTAICEEEEKVGYFLNANQKLRILTLKEIIETEESYTKLLQFIVDVIIPKMTECIDNDSCISVNPNTIQNLFSNITDIHKLHIKLTAELKEATSPYPYHTNCIGEVFLKYREDFSAYKQFCSNCKTAHRISYELESDPAMKKFIDKWKETIASKSRNFIHLEEFVITPVQRLCKYPLLLKELVRYTGRSHPDYSSVIEAKQMMDEVTMSVNESDRRAIAIQAIRDLEDACDSWERSGKLSKYGFMTKQRSALKTWSNRWFILSGYKMSYYSEPTDTIPLGVLDLTSYKSFEENMSQMSQRPFCFGINMPDKIHLMYCVSEEVKKEWITILKWKFSCIDRSRRQAHRPLETAIFASLSSVINPKNHEAAFQSNENPMAEKPKPRRTKSLFPFTQTNRQQRNRFQSAN